MGILQKLRHKMASLKTRILFIFVVTTTVTVVVLSLAIGRASTTRLTQSATQTAAQNLAIIADKLDVFFDNIENDALYMIYTSQLQMGAEETDTQDAAYQNFTHFKQMYAFLLDFVHTNSNYVSVAYFEGGQQYVSDPALAPEGYTGEHLALVQQFIEGDKVLAWYDLHPRPYAIREGKGFGDEAPYHYSLLRKCFDTRGNFLGVLELSIGENVLAAVYQNHNTETANFFVLNSVGEVVSSPLEEMRGTSVAGESWFAALAAGESEAVRDGDTLYVHQSYPRMGWTVVGAIPLQEINQDSNALVGIILAVGLLAILISFVIFLGVARRITGPIEKITSAVDDMSHGDYGARIPLQAKDEIGVLARQINEMAANTQQLMVDIEEENQQKRQYELSYIQSQMNPHFLYNALETMCGMIEMGEKNEAIQYIGNVSKFYRSVLSGGEITVSLADELAIVESYLKVMQQRYPGSFGFTVDCPSALRGIQIPKLTLQPIIENAIIHGCITCADSNTITIAGRKEENALRLTIADDGNGMDAARLAAVRGAKAGSGGFGFASTEKRLQLGLGEGARVEIQSAPGAGTTVTLWLPLGGEEN